MPVPLPSIPHLPPLVLFPELPPMSRHIPDTQCPGKDVKEFCGHMLVLNVSLPCPAHICRLFHATLFDCL